MRSMHGARQRTFKQAWRELLALWHSALNLTPPRDASRPRHRQAQSLSLCHQHLAANQGRLPQKLPVRKEVPTHRQSRKLTRSVRHRAPISPHDCVAHLRLLDPMNSGTVTHQNDKFGRHNVATHKATRAFPQKSCGHDKTALQTFLRFNLQEDLQYL